MAFGLANLRDRATAGVADPRKKLQDAQSGVTRVDDGVPSSAGAGSTAPRQAAQALRSAPQTFSQMQSQGIARPAPPPAFSLSPMTMGQIENAPGSQGFPASPNFLIADGGPLPSIMPPTQAPGPTPTTPTSPPTLPGPSNPSTPGKQGSPLDADLTARILGWLGNPQGAYSSDAFNSDVKRAYDQIDDEYSLNQKSLADNLAARGLGTTGDSSIGLGRLSDLNVGRKSAKENVLGTLSSDRDKRFSADLQAAVNAALGYNQQLYGHDYLGKQVQMQGLTAALQALVQSGGLDPALQDQVLSLISTLGLG